MTLPPRRRLIAAAKAAFPPTIPILAGFIFLGITCGIYASSLGLPWWVPPLMSICIFAGSAEFFVINARHLFYGISMLDRFRGLGRKRAYLIFGMCDETFSINYAAKVPKGIDRGWFMFFVSLFNQLYWICGCTLGAVCGTLLAVHIEGVSFAMTALFVVIFLDQWLKDGVHAGAWTGILASLGTLIVFGPDGFIIPAMILILIVLTLTRTPVERALAAHDERDGDDA